MSVNESPAVKGCSHGAIATAIYLSCKWTPWDDSIVSSKMGVNSKGLSFTQVDVNMVGT